MGIDVYLRWTGMTEEERKAQYTGFSIGAGGVGYLREAYHGSPYATRVLVPESFNDELYGDDDFEGVPISWVEMARKLPQAVLAALTREAEVYHNAEARELLCEMGIEPRLAGSEHPEKKGVEEIVPHMLHIFSHEIPSMKTQKSDFGEVRRIPNDGFQRLLAFPMVASLCQFVALARKKEEAIGQPCRVYTSY